MDNKSVMKAMVSAAKVKTDNQVFERIVDYTINADKDGKISYTAGCLDEKNHYWSVPCDDLICDVDLREVKYGKIPWGSPYTVETVLEAMKSATPVTAGNFRYHRIARLSVVVNRPQEDPRYTITCEDVRGNTVTVAAEQVRIDDIPVEAENKEETT